MILQLLNRAYSRPIRCCWQGTGNSFNYHARIHLVREACHQTTHETHTRTVINNKALVKDRGRLSTARII